MIFESRRVAGRKLASELGLYKNKRDAIILALPRGGLPIGFEISKILHLPLEILVAHKIGAPHDPEFGIGAVAEGGVRVLDDETITYLGIPPLELEQVIHKEEKDIKRKVKLYRNNKNIPSLKKKTVIIVDDGLATGVTARAAVAAVRQHNPKKIIFAAPACAFDSTRRFKNLVDEIICITTPIDFSSVGLWYKNFEEITDMEVMILLKKSREIKAYSL